MRDYEEKSYYEIQLDNKQLIMVFLAGVTVCVLIFVLGVMVGKGKKETEMAMAARSEATPPRSPQQDLQQPAEPFTAQDQNAPAAAAPAPKKQAKESEKKKPDDRYTFY